MQQSFEGPFSGRALLIFPQAQSLELVRSIVGDGALPGGCDRSGGGGARRDRKYHLERVPGHDRECAASHNADVVAFHSSGRWRHAVRRGGGTADNLVLFLYIDFTIKNRDIHGFIALLMDLPSIAALKEIVRDFIDGIGRAECRQCWMTCPTSNMARAFDAVDIGIIVLDEQRRIVGWNELDCAGLRTVQAVRTRQEPVRHVSNGAEYPAAFRHR